MVDTVTPHVRTTSQEIYGRRWTNYVQDGGVGGTLDPDKCPGKGNVNAVGTT